MQVEGGEKTINDLSDFVSTDNFYYRPKSTVFFKKSYSFDKVDH